MDQSGHQTARPLRLIHPELPPMDLLTCCTHENNLHRDEQETHLGIKAVRAVMKVLQSSSEGPGHFCALCRNGLTQLA